MLCRSMAGPRRVGKRFSLQFISLSRWQYAARGEEFWHLMGESERNGGCLKGGKLSVEQVPWRFSVFPQNRGAISQRSLMTRWSHTARPGCRSATGIWFELPDTVEERRRNSPSKAGRRRGKQGSTINTRFVFILIISRELSEAQSVICLMWLHHQRPLEAISYIDWLNT